MDLIDFLEMLSWKELTQLGEILEGVNRKTRLELVESILDACLIRWRVWKTSGVRVKISRKPKYGDGWKFCQACHLSIKYVSNPLPEKVKNRCPVCHRLLRNNSKTRKKTH